MALCDLPCLGRDGNYKQCQIPKPLGPFAGDFDKFQSKVASINGLHPPPALARILFASRALPVLAHIAPVSPHFHNSEKKGMSDFVKSVRLFGNALSYMTPFNPRLVKGPDVLDLLANSASCGLRAADKNSMRVLAQAQ